MYEAVKNEPIPHIIKRSQVSKRRQLITARQLQKLAKQGQLVFLAVVRPANNVARASRKKVGNKKSPIIAAAAHGMTEGQKRRISKETGPKKEFISVAEREQQIINSVTENCLEKLQKIIHQYRDVFREKLSKGLPADRQVQHQIKLNRAAGLPISHLAHWVLGTG